ncbi:unannotated protein [freshwater metagenome]|uniref:Unannotated protein n=1 Tax=freshwater metagenome TaxID=449393 RepID=A0A6J7HMI8_9ZZZZ
MGPSGRVPLGIADGSDPFTEFTLEHRASLVRLAYVITGDAYLAEDLVQGTLIKAYRFWDRVSAADSPRAYVRQILVREHLSWRRRMSSREVVHPEPTILVPPLVTQLPDHSAREEAWHLLATLPPKQRTVLALRYFDDLSDEDIATTMGVSAVTVRTNASRGLATLRARLQQTKDYI